MRRDASVLILYDAQGRVFLQHREKERTVSPNLWAFFGGGLNPGETPDDALKREAFEELEWNTKQPRKVFSFDLQPKWGFETILHVYIEPCNDTSGLVLHEGQNWGWFHEEEAAHLAMSEWDREILRQIFEQLAKLRT